MFEMLSYDLMEVSRSGWQWAGQTARTAAGNPFLSQLPLSGVKFIEAWGKITEHSFSRMVAKPDWDIDGVIGHGGRVHPVSTEVALELPFCDLVKFHVDGLTPRKHRVLVVAPMSGHHATLLRSTVASLLPDCETYVTDWRDARQVPVSAGRFDVEDYTLYIKSFIEHLGPGTHVLAVCQPVPLVLAATALLAKRKRPSRPASLVLMGGPVDPDAAPTEVTDFGRRLNMETLEPSVIRTVGFKYPGVGRRVYPGLMQLASFMSMNPHRHGQAFLDEIRREAAGEASDADPHNRFYDEYLAVMDMSAEFYLSTVDRIFKKREVARNAFEVKGHHADLTRIRDVPVLVIEGEKDDISAPGQCAAALPLLSRLPEEMKAIHLEPGAGHYGIFAGKAWRNNIRPVVLSFIGRSQAA